MKWQLASSGLAGCTLGHEVGSASVECLLASCVHSCVGFELRCAVKEDLVECSGSMCCRGSLRARACYQHLQLCAPLTLPCMCVCVRVFAAAAARFALR